MDQNADLTHLSRSALTVYVLGRFAVYRGETLIEDSAWQRQKAKKLFKLLLLAPHRRMHKDQILDLLWPDKTSDIAANNLNRTLFILRRVLQPALESAAQSHYLWFRDDMLMLNPAAIAWVDADAFEHLVQLARQQNHNLDQYNAALELYKGELLPEDLYEDWAEYPRSQLHTNYVDALKRVANIYIERRDYPLAVETLTALLHVEPTDESAQRDLMRLYIHTGARHKALQLYQQSVLILRDELGVEPSVETTALYKAILHETLPPAFIPIASPVDARPAAAEDAARLPLISRQPELGSLIKYLHQAQAGHGNVVFLVGERGVGKTRLAEELIAYARTAGIKIFQGTAFDGEGRLLYAPFVGIIRRGLNPQLIEQIHLRFGSLATDLARLLPELLKSGPAGADKLEAAASGLNIELGDRERRRLFDAIAATYSLFAQSAPVLVFLDNMHAAGEASLQLLHYLARQVANQRLLFLCAVDQDQLQRGTPLALVLADLQHNRLSHRLNLQRLTRVEVAQLCASLLDDSVRDSTIPDSIYELTEGNPFFVKELVLSLIQLGKIERQDGAWRMLPESRSIVPSSVEEIIGMRLSHLGDDARRLLGIAAGIGNVFNFDLLQAATNWERSRLLDAFDELLKDALIESTETAYRFQHAMIRQAVYNELSAERRAWLHEQVAKALEIRLAGHPDEQAAILAYHYEHAGDLVTAVHYLVHAGDWARQAYALREALEHYNRAFEMCRLRAAAPDAFIGLLEKRSQTFLALSDFDLAIGDLEQMLKSYQDSGSQARAGETLYQIGFAHYWAHRLMKAATYLDQALYVAEALDYPDLRNRVLRLRDILNSTQGSVTGSSATDTAPAADTRPLLHAEEYWGYAMLAHLRYDFEAAQRHAQSCIDVGEASTNTFLSLGGYFILGMSQASQGQYQTALDSLHKALKLSDVTDDRFWRARLLNTLGWVYRDLFSLELAGRYDRESLELARASTPRLTEAEGNALANLTMTYLLLGQPDTARVYLDEGFALSASEPFMRWRYFTRLLIAQGDLALVDGNIGEALNAADKALDLARHTKARKNIARSCSLRGRIHLALGETDKARAALRHALAVTQKLGAPGMIWPCQLALAELEDEDGRPDAARSYYGAALKIIEPIAAGLTDPALRQCFLDAGPIRKVLAHARA